MAISAANRRADAARLLYDSRKVRCCSDAEGGAMRGSQKLEKWPHVETTINYTVFTYDDSAGTKDKQSLS
jgi:hypothetical protein